MTSTTPRGSWGTNLGGWAQTGKVLARLAMSYDYEQWEGPNRPTTRG